VSNKKLIDTVEQKDVYEELGETDTEPFIKAGLSHQVLREILIIVKQSQRSKASIKLNEISLELVSDKPKQHIVWQL
jgi:hypothetical protein